MVEYCKLCYPLVELDGNDECPVCGWYPTELDIALRWKRREL